MNRVLLMLIVLVFPVNIALSLMSPIWADYIKKLHGTLEDAGNVYAVMTWSGAFALIIMPMIQRWLKIPDILMLLIGFLCPIVAAIWYFYLDSVMQFYFLQIILSFGIGSVVPILLSWYQDFLKHSFSSRGWGINNAMIAVAGGIGALISGHIVYRHSYTMLFQVYLSTSILSYILMLFTTWIYKNNIKRVDEFVAEPETL